MEIKNNSSNSQIRNGLKDIWNAFMAKDAFFCTGDIPFCPTTATTIPTSLITWEEAKSIYKKQLKKDSHFICNSFVCFYIDDYKFDGPKGIWNDPQKALEILSHFEGIITPDYSTYQDFPDPIKRYSTYRMRLFGYWLGKNNIKVINNVRWGTEETFSYCFEGIPSNNIICLGTVGGSPRKNIYRKRFETGLNKAVEVLNPKTILIYGSANYPCFQNLKNQGIEIIEYPSRTSLAFKENKKNE